MLNLRLSQPDLLVDISRLPELAAVSQDNGRLLVGAATPHAAFEDGLVPDVAGGLLRRIAGGIAYRAVRNRGTLGGSLAHADAAAEWPAAMTALDARLRIRGGAGRRTLAARDFLLGAMTTALADDELIEAVEIPALAPGARWGFRKHSRKVGEFAMSLAVVIDDRERRYCRVVLGAAGGAPLILDGTARLVAGMSGWRAGQEAEIRSGFDADIAAAGLQFDDYTLHLHGVTVLRAIRDAFTA
jgi:carbon-monoxide dehydrogenase medium subunit